VLDEDFNIVKGLIDKFRTVARTFGNAFLD
jgi:hypothetical protein